MLLKVGVVLLCRPMHMTMEHAEHFILACCVLHNYLMTKTVEWQQLVDTIGPDGSVKGGT